MNRVVTVADIAKKIKEAITKEFPDYKFGVSSSNFAGGCSVSISLMAAPFEVYANGPVRCHELSIAVFSDDPEIVGYWNNGLVMTPEGWGTMEEVWHIAKSFQRYYTFFLHIGVGNALIGFKNTERG